MASTQALPSIMNNNYFNPTSEKIFAGEEDVELSKWLKLDETSSFNYGFPFNGSALESASGPSTTTTTNASTSSSFESTPSSSSSSDFNNSFLPTFPFSSPTFNFPFASGFQAPVAYPPNYMQYPPNVPQMMGMPMNYPPIMNGAAPMNFQQMAPFYQLFNQFQQLFKQQQQQHSTGVAVAGLTMVNLLMDEIITDDKTRRPIRPFTRRVRQTRPKVVEAKGAVQCNGRNRKKGTQCRNAALMEYIGPRPAYCAEHIELDPMSLYEKCKSPYQKEVGDNKGCKEVVLKEFGLCYKHFHDLCNTMIRARDLDKAKHVQTRVCDLLAQLEREASAAKKKDGDLYQRKNKLIPKFQEMRKLANKCVETLQNMVADPTMDCPPLLGQTSQLDSDSSPAEPTSFQEQPSSNLISTLLSEVEDQFIGSELSSDSDFSDEAENLFAH
jgi:hypothetical protein